MILGFWDYWHKLVKSRSLLDKMLVRVKESRGGESDRQNGDKTTTSVAVLLGGGKLNNPLAQIRTM